METKTHKLIRLIKTEKYSKAKVAELCSVTRNTVRRWNKRIEELGEALDSFQSLTEAEIKSQVNSKSQNKCVQFYEPNWEKLRVEIAKKRATGKLLYEEYIANAPEQSNLMSLSQFYFLLNGKKKRGVEMSFIYVPGEQIQFDFVGKRPDVLVDRNGENIRYEVGVGVSSQSRMIFAKALPSQATDHSIHFISDMLEFFGGAPTIMIVDNFKAAILIPRAGKKDAVINPRFQACADHYGFGVSPARSLNPRDKGLAENSVRQVQMSILHKIRHNRFSTLTELNEAISHHLIALNDRPMKGHNGLTRKALFEGTDKAGYYPLPPERYIDGEWFLNRAVRSNLTFEAGGNHYSVPEQYMHEKVNAKLTSTTAFVYFENHQITTHVRSYKIGEVIFKKSHRPASHQYMDEGTLAQLISLVAHIGENAIAFMRNQYRVNSRSPNSRKAAWAVSELAEEFGNEATDRGCMISNKIKSTTIHKLRSIVSASPISPTSDDELDDILEVTSNVRGPKYYNAIISAKENKKCPPTN